MLDCSMRRNKQEGQEVVIRIWDFTIENVKNFNLLIMTRSRATQSNKNMCCVYNLKFHSSQI